MTPKTNSQDILTKGSFTRDEWNYLLTLFNISHFSSTACIAAMAKRAQQESGEGRVTAKSRPMMNLTARLPSFVPSSASSNPGRTSYGYQDPGKSVFSAVGVEKLPFLKIFVFLHGLMTWLGHAKKCVERYCELANKTTQQLYKVSTPCIDDHHFKEEETKSVWRIVTCMLSNCSKMLILGKNWTTD